MTYLKRFSLFCLLISYLCLNSVIIAQNFWTPIGEGGGIYGSHVNALAVDSDGILYAATWGGLFYSADNGNLWISLGFEDQVMWDVIVLDGNKIYATSGSAVYYSDNKGDSWSNRNIPFSGGANAFTIGADGLLYAATINGPFILNKDTNYWQRVEGFSDISLDGSRGLAVDSSGTIYSATALDSETGGLFRSPDSGNVWKEITPPAGTRVVKSIEVDKNSRVWAGTGTGIFFSDDKGETWKKVNSLPSYKFFSIRFSGENTIYAGFAGGLFVSNNGGNSWAWILDKSVFDVAFLTDTNPFVATMKGVFYFNNDSLWIEKNTGMTSAFINDIAFDNNEKLYMASSVGLYSSIDDGYSFNIELSEFGGKDIDARSILVAENGDIFVGTSNKGIYYKTGENNSWQNAYASGIITGIVKHSSDVLFAGSWGRGVSVSKDNGKSWQKTNLPNNLSVADMLVAANGKLFAGTTKSDEDPWFIGYYYSSDAGKNWKRSVFQEYYGTGQQIWAMTKLPNNDLFMGTGFGVFRSKDNGKSWDHIYEEYLQTRYGKSLVGIEDFAVSKDEKIFAGTDHGIICSEDKGITWKFLESTGLVNKRISCIEISPKGYLFIGTSGSGGSTGGGTFRSLQKVANSSDFPGNNDPEYFTLSQNYPNPFNPGTSISYFLPDNKDLYKVVINIYDALGRLVRKLENTHKSPGQYVVEWNGKDQSDNLVNSGVYFYSLSAGELKKTKKMLLLR